MPLGPPVFPLLGDMWTPGFTPAAHAPSVTGIPCQLFISPYSTMRYDAALGNPWTMTTIIKVPYGTGGWLRNSIWKPDNTWTRYYLCVYWEQFYKGFSSAYDGIIVFQCTNTGAVPAIY